MTKSTDTTRADLEWHAGEMPLSGRGPDWLRRAILIAWLRRATIVVVMMSAVLVATGSAIMIVTPSVGNAGSLDRAQAALHHSAFPGPPVPARFAAALISTEDHRFAGEPGVDPIAIARVLLARVTSGRDQGGATLYQQLAKLLYTPGQAGFGVEVEQIALGIKLKFSYTGAQILRMYAGVVYFGHGFYGLAAASCGYFGRPADRLSWAQAALLAGLVQAPSAYDPLAFPGRARGRERHVIARLVATGVLSARQAATALSAPVSSLTAKAGQGCRAFRHRPPSPRVAAGDRDAISPDGGATPGGRG